MCCNTISQFRYLGLALVTCATVVALRAQEPKTNPRLAPVRVFEGVWIGTASGQPGKGVSMREYQFELKGAVLTARNRSKYEPKKAGAEPEVHEDMAVFSYDTSSKRIILRQFHSEGFVNEYALDSQSADDKTVQFTTFKIDGIPEGWRAREIYRVVSDDDIVETFLLAGPGKDFEVYSETRLKRQK